MKTYIYIDTKIIGAFKQTISYFEENVFDNQSTILIWKNYKEINKKINKLLNKYSINHISFNKYSEIPQLVDNSIVFYLFNAQSNCRLVANRKLKHIFVTHGESNKVSSIKPIIRVYDYVIVAGNVGIRRYLDYDIFSKCDVEKGKLIRMGNTFIGNIGISYDKNSDTVLYAPTWEGGVEEENYSSLSKNLDKIKIIANFILKNRKKNIIIQLHPNLGHRDKNYKKYLLNSIKYFQLYDINVFIKNWKFSFFDKIQLRNNIFSFDQLENKSVCYAFCDVSAIEIQLLEKHIPYFIFFNDTINAIPDCPILEEYYEKFKNYKFNIDNTLVNKIRNYYISYEEDYLKNLSKSERMKWLKWRISKE